jgi:hypothetical protein
MPMRIEPEIGAASIVLLGSFNPKIFQPFWMAKHGLISDSEAQVADVAVIHAEISAFMIEDLFTLQVNPTRFSIERNVAPLILICDVVTRLFTDLLPHVPIQQMGINRVVHFNVGLDERDRIGLMLAPREPWGEWGKEVSSGVGTKHGGLQSLTLVQKNVSDRPSGWIQAKIEPSARLGGGRTGIYMEVNDHYQLTDDSQTSTPEAMMVLLSKVFGDSIRRSEGIIDQIMSLKR